MSGPNRRLESEVEREFVQKLKGYVAIKLTEQHWPDRLILTANGRCGFIEFKRPGENPRPGQQHVLGWLRRSGFECIVARSAQQALDWVQNGFDTEIS